MMTAVVVLATGEQDTERSRRWRAGEAVVWRCAGCRCVLGFVADRTLRIEHEGRVIEATGDEFKQICHQCRTINTRRPQEGPR